MKFLILLQILIATNTNFCKCENDGNATTITQEDDVQVDVPTTEMNITDRSDSRELLENFREDDESNENNLDFEYDEDDEEGEDEPGAEAQEAAMNMKDAEKVMQEALLKAMRKPLIKKQIGEVMPILRVMSPAQRLTLAALVSSQIMSRNTLSEANLSQIASTFAGKNLETSEERNNVTEYLLLPISMDIAKMFRGLGREVGRNLRENTFNPRRRESHQVFRRRRIRKPPPPPYKPQTVVKRRIDDTDYYEFVEDIAPSRASSKNKSSIERLKQPGKEDCDYFTKSLCLEVTNYPTEAIISSLRKNAEIAKTFLTDFDVQTTRLHTRPKRNKARGRQLDRLESHAERRQDDRNDITTTEEDSNYMCPSTVKYARPKRARTTSGHWKYIVNTGDYTQTLRLEMCLKQNSPCSYVTNHINSECAQVFNYHRLLTWDETKGLHMDVFKVPSCCSCRIQGYSNFFPPNNEFTYAEKRREPYHNADSRVPVQEHPHPAFTSGPQERPAIFNQPAQERPLLNSPVPERPLLINNGGNVGDVPNVIPLGNIPAPSIKSHVIYQAPTIKDFPKNPAEHLVPPGPPLPLENEGAFSTKQETKYYGNNSPIEQNVRYSLVTENVRTTNKPEYTERIEVKRPVGNVITLSQTHVSTPEPTVAHPTPVLISQTHHHVVLPTTHYDGNAAYEQGSQLRYIIPLVNNPLALSKDEDVKKFKSVNGGLFNKPGKTHGSGHKSNGLRHSGQHYNRDYSGGGSGGDSQGVATRVKPTYVTPPREVTTSTTSPPPIKSEIITASGHKKINYNYHPIIDFFQSETNKKRQPVYSAPTQAAQDWTPVL